jgi:hypothetical protein
LNPIYKVIGSLPFTSISTWGHSPVSFVLVVNSWEDIIIDDDAPYLMPQKPSGKLTVRTNRGEEMAARIGNFVKSGEKYAVGPLLKLR